MSQTEDPAVKVTLPNGEKLEFKSAAQLKGWTDGFLAEWGWLDSSGASAIWNSVRDRLHNTSRIIENWSRHSSPQTAAEAQASIDSAIAQINQWTRGVFWDSTSRTAIAETRKSVGHEAAVGMFVGLAKCDLRIQQTIPSDVFAGLIRAYLFHQGIDLTASAHHSELSQLEVQIRQTLQKQEHRLQELTAADASRQEAHELSMTTKSGELDALRDEKMRSLDELRAQKEQQFAQVAEQFKEMAAKHESNLKAIEDTFHNKLALQKPVAFWQAKQVEHTKMTKRFAWASAIALVVLGGLLAGVMYWAFSSLEPKEDPKTWEVGVTIVTAFFVIWVVRILIRLFLSHQHLGIDAAERVTMVQTFLSLSLEQHGIAKEDRSIILQQLFRSASDGLVKDDAAPPSWVEFLTRQK